MCSEEGGGRHAGGRCIFVAGPSLRKSERSLLPEVQLGRPDWVAIRRARVLLFVKVWHQGNCVWLRGFGLQLTVHMCPFH